MEIPGYIASLFIGLLLGLVGGGGSILTVPVLVYLFGVEAVTATTYSLFIVGTTSLVGALPRYRRGEVDIRTAITFGIPTLVSVYATRAWVVPAIPHDTVTVGNIAITKPVLIMVLFATLMLAAAASMIRKTSVHETGANQARHVSYPLVLLEGVALGFLTGMVGAGGGFLIIPALVFVGRLPMKVAVGTSLIIIAANSLIGFLGDPGKHEMNWPLLLTITLLAILGIFAGNLISRRIAAEKLRAGFGWFVLLMGSYILISEILSIR